MPRPSPGSGGPASSTPNGAPSPATPAWVGHFLDAVGDEEVALVAGHSFGGGVATAFVYDQPGRVVVPAAGQRRRQPDLGPVPQRGPHHGATPGVGLGTPLRHRPAPLAPLVRLLPTLLEDFIPNLVHNPLGMFRTGEFIRRADLVREVRAIAQWGIPVTVAWSDRDRLVPRSAFDELRHAAGVDGVVVEGAHAWLIADPDGFGELAISALVDSRALAPRSPRAAQPPDGLTADPGAGR